LKRAAVDYLNKLYWRDWIKPRKPHPELAVTRLCFQPGAFKVKF